MKLKNDIENEVKKYISDIYCDTTIAASIIIAFSRFSLIKCLLNFRCSKVLFVIITLETCFNICMITATYLSKDLMLSKPHSNISEAFISSDTSVIYSMCKYRSLEVDS